jgi:CHASE2 domain-containing sensor protein
MSSKVFLNLGAGNLHSGFERIESRLEIDGKLVAKTQASLPSNLELQDLHYQWQFCYAAYYDNCGDLLRGTSSNIELDATGMTGFSVTTFAETTIELAREMRRWLDSSSFREIGDRLYGLCHYGEDEVIIAIESEDERIYRLPWHCWRAVADRPQVEIIFSLNTYQRQPSISHRTKPRVLAVFGDSTGIDTTVDAASIRRLPVDLVLLAEPSIARLKRELDDRQGWDILFFAGHGSEDNISAVRLNATESVTSIDLSLALTAAIGRGLKLAIFNCCSGLGLGTSLAKLNIPTAIVMREAIPNRVAQQFLQAFLDRFESGASLLAAVAAARQQLQSLETDFPCASWLPVVFWNPTVELPTWRSFYPQPLQRMRLRQLAAIVLATTAAIWGIRSQGYLEPVELVAYDLTMTARPMAEAPDDRIVIIGVNRDRPIGDRLLVQTLTKLQQAQPKAIGLDIYRDLPFDEGHRDLATLLQNRDVIICSCLMPGQSQDFSGVAAPTGVRTDRVGFSNFSLDLDRVLRRQVLGMAPIDPTVEGGCSTDHALSLRLALKYLGIAAADEADNGNLKIGSREIAVLGNNFGGYRSSAAQENLRGFQVMLNYRNAPQIALQIDLDEFLRGSIDPAQIAGKVVLLGYVGNDSGDNFRTLAGMSDRSGVAIHAQMTSNILSHLLDARPLITTWGDPIELGWICLWGAVGGVIWYRLRGVQIWIAVSGSLVLLIVTCVGCLGATSIWIPLIPAGMAVILTPLVAWSIVGTPKVSRRNKLTLLTK